MTIRSSRLIAVLTLCALVLTAVPAVATPAAPDIEGHWAEAAIEQLVDMGAVSGLPDGTFRPDLTVTRAEFVTMVNKSFGITPVPESTRFQDVKPGDWFGGQVEAAAAYGYVTGNPDGTFSPYRPITREQAAAMLVRVFGFSKLATEAEQDAVLAPFADADKVSAWAKADVATAISLGLLSGYTPTTLAPQPADLSAAGWQQWEAARTTEQREAVLKQLGSHGLITRAQTAAILVRALALEPAVEATVFDQAGTYGPEDGVETISGDVIVKADGVTLQNLIITGDLIITESVGDGTVVLENVTVKGDTEVKGGGTDSVIFRDCTLHGTVTVEKVDGQIRIVAEGSTSVPKVVLQSGAILISRDDGSFERIELPKDLAENTEVVLTGNFAEVEIAAENANVTIGAGSTVNSLVLTENATGTQVDLDQEASVTTVTADAEVEITGQGTIGTAEINVDGVTIEQKPDKVVLEPGVKANVGGKDVTEPKKSTGGGGGRRDETVSVSAISVNKETLLLEVGTSEKITATISPSDATNQKVTWLSSDETIATVDENGNIHALKAGKVEITVVSTDNTNIKAVCEVTVAKDWSDLANTTWFGQGTEETYTISTAKELAGLAQLVNSGTTFSGKTIKIDEDIDLLNLEWLPIGTKDNPFKGKFDGTEKTISNLKIDAPESKYAGLFGNVVSGSLKNINLSEISINAKEYVGSLTGRAFTLTEPITNVHVSNVEINSTHYAGGVVGHSYAHVSNCSADNVKITLVFDTKIEDNGDKAGGITGYQGEGSYIYEDCIVTNAKITGVRDVGGLVGASQRGLTYINCQVTDSEITADNTTGTDSSPFAGGLIGRAVGSITLYDSTAHNVVVKSYDADYTGKLVGGPASNVTIAKVLNSTQKKAYETIQAAIDAASAGDVIIVGDGEYTENLTINKAITLKSLNGRESTEIAGTITITADDVTVEGFTVTAQGYYAVPVIHMIDIDNVNILNNTVVADATAYGAIGTSTGPAKVTGIISGNTVTGMIIVGTDGDLEVSDNNVTLTPASTEGICFYPVGSTAVITVTGNTVGDVTEGNVQIKVNEKPLSVNGENSELDMLAAITADNNEATAKLGWFTLADSTVAVIGATQYDTLRTAIDAAEEGDTIFLLPGEIHEGTTGSGEILSFNLPLNMQNITIKGSGAGDSGTVFKDMTITHNHNGFAPYSFYDGLTFDSIRFENTAICLENRTWSATGHQFKDIAIKNCMFINCSGRAGVGAVYIDAQYNAGNFTFENNTVDNIVDEVGGAAAVILNPFNGNITIEGNEFKNMTGHRPLHIKFDLGNGGDDVIVVKDNTFIDNSRGILIQEYGSGDDKTTINVNNNIFANTGDTNVLEGIRIDTAADGLSIRGNTFTGLAEAVGFTAAKDTEANFLALKADIIENNTGATDANVTAYGTFMGDLTEYNELLAAVKEEDYTTASWEAYQAIVEENQVTGASSQREIDIAIVNIKYAQMDLILATVKNITTEQRFDSIKAAIDAATTGDNIIAVYPGNYGTESIDIVQKEGVNITLEAVGEVELKNQIRISGAGRWNDEETLTIKGFTFDFTDATEAVDIISATKKLLDDTNNYAHNVSIENNVFKGNPEADVVAIRTNGVFGLEIKSSQGIGLHSLGQIQAQSKYFRVIDTTVEGGESGINYYGPADVEITGLTVEGTGYGVRAGQSSGAVNETAKLTISDSNLTALYPVWLRGDAPGTVVITNSNLEPTEDGPMIYDVTSGTVNITIDGKQVLADGLTYDAASDTYEISNANGLIYANKNLFNINLSNNKYKLGADIDMSDVTDWNSNVSLNTHFELDGGGYKISGLKTTSDALLVPRSTYTVTIKNLTLENCEVNTASEYAAMLVGYADANTVTIDNCHVIGGEVQGTKYAGALIGWSSKNINITSSAVKNTSILGAGSTGGIVGHCAADQSGIANITDVTIEGCTIKGENLEKSGIVVGTANVGKTTITTNSIVNNTVFEIENSDAIYGRFVPSTTGKLTINGTPIP